MEKIAIFASGSGSNAEKIIAYFSNIKDFQVSLVISNNKEALVLDKSKKNDIPTYIVTRENFYKKESILQHLKQCDIDFIVLAGFLWLIPKELITAYPNKIINIHPALLPKYGGKGMYGHHVHKAVKKSGDKESGMTIHYVNEKYDDGSIIIQSKCDIKQSDDWELIAKKVLQLEHKYYARTIHQIILGNL